MEFGETQQDRNRRKVQVVVLAVAVAAVLAEPARAQTARTAWYQPTPIASTIPVENSHVLAGFLGSVYNQTLTRDKKFQVGGWGDEYRSFLKFDLDGLPRYTVTNAALWLYAYPRNDGSTTTQLAMCKVGSYWDRYLTWGSQPLFPTCWGYYNSTPNQWLYLSITSWYNEWQSGTTTNNGVMLFPRYKNNNFDVFRSTSYGTSPADFAADPYADGKRPVLQLDFTSTLELKMPFNGNRWAVSTEIGGVGCSYLHSGHTGNGYFSIDFTPNAKNASGGPVYSDPGTADIPILAAASGRVTQVSTDRNSSTGYSVRIRHGNTGIETGYYHMKYPPKVGQVDVLQGQLLGYMGDTGTGVTGKHLDFNLRYNNFGDKSQEPLARVMMEGHILKGYQADCSGGTSVRYYQSTNVMR